MRFLSNNTQQTGQLRKLPNSDQFFKNYDRMIALLAICVHVCPNPSNSNHLEESIAKTIREKHGAQLSKDAFTELFVFCSPKFISPFIPDFTQPPPSSPGAPWVENALKHQVRLLEHYELAPQATFRELRSYLKLYTSISMSKLVSFGNDPVSLLALKLFMRQLESDKSSTAESTPLLASAVTQEATSTSVAPSWKNASYKSALDVHYYLVAEEEEKKKGDDATVHIDGAEKQRQFENYFLAQTVQSYDIRKEANAIGMAVTK